MEELQVHIHIVMCGNMEVLSTYVCARDSNLKTQDSGFRLKIFMPVLVMAVFLVVHH